MTDEVKTEEVVAPVTPPVEAVPVTPATPATTEQREYSAVEQRALDQGWRPIEEWDGAPEDHRSAREYLDRGELLGKIKSQSQEMKEVKQMLTTLSAHNQKVYLAGYEKGLTEMKAQRAEALRSGDVDTALAIEDKMDEQKAIIATIKAAPPVSPKPSNEPSPLFTSWLDRNKWYETDEAMRNWADGAAMALGKKAKAEGRQLGEQDVYDHLTKIARETFPQKFSRVGAPSPDGEGRKSMQGKTGGKGGDKFEALLATFDEQAAHAARSLVKSGLLTKDKYVEDYERIGQ